MKAVPEDNISTTCVELYASYLMLLLKIVISPVSVRLVIPQPSPTKEPLKIEDEIVPSASRLFTKV